MPHLVFHVRKVDSPDKSNDVDISDTEGRRNKVEIKYLQNEKRKWSLIKRKHLL